MKIFKISFVFLLSSAFLFVGFQTYHPKKIFAQDDSKNSDSGAKIIAGNQEIETPIFGVRFIEAQCTDFIAGKDLKQSIKLAYQVIIRPRDFNDLILEFLCTEVTVNARQTLTPVALPIKEGVIDYCNFIPDELSARYYFKLRLSILSTLEAQPAYSQIFMSEVNREANPSEPSQTQPQTRTDITSELKIADSKLFHSVRVEPLTKNKFYDMKISLLLEIKNPLLPIIWDRTVNYKYNPLVPSYFKGAFAPPNTDLTMHLREIWILPPNNIFKLQIAINLTYFEELFPLIYKQTDNIEMNYENYKITLLFTITNAEKFPPEITCSLDSPNAEPQTFKVK